MNSGPIRDYNKLNFPDPDFSTNDLASCVASAAIINPPNLYYGFIADCGVAVISEDGKVQKTENQGPDKFERKVWEKNYPGKTWRDKEAKRDYLSKYRNKPGEPMSFGVLNGEPKGEHYITTGIFSLRKGDTVLVYSDGMALALFDEAGNLKPRFRDVFSNDLNGLERLCRREATSEATLVYSRI